MMKDTIMLDRVGRVFSADREGVDAGAINREFVLRERDGSCLKRDHAAIEGGQAGHVDAGVLEQDLPGLLVGDPTRRD